MSPEKLSLVVQAEVEETGATVEGHGGPHFTYVTRAWGAEWASSTLEFRSLVSLLHLGKGNREKSSKPGRG